MYDLAVKNGLVYIDGEYKNTNIYIKDGIISKITPDELKASEVYNASSKNVYPGIIDPHTHFELDLGKLISQDDFHKGTIAAAFGGVTTIIDFLSPVNDSMDLDIEFFLRKLQAENSVIDYKFHACLKDPENQVDDLVKAMKTFGLNTVKIFTTYSDTNRRTYEKEIVELLKLSKEHDFLITVHAEDDDLINFEHEYSYVHLPISRPTESEVSAALNLAKLVMETGGYMYMVHLSSGETLKRLKESYPEILNTNFFIESCPHYFTFSKDRLKGDEGYLYTMAPPLRSKEEVTLLNELIDDVYTIGTDHCTFNRIVKQKRLLKFTPLGVGGIEYSFDIMYSLFGDKIIDKMTKNVAKVHKLFPQKGVIQEGSDADLFIYELGENILTENHSGTDYFIYKDMTVKGKTISTISRGAFVVKDRKFIPHKGILLNKAVTE